MTSFASAVATLVLAAGLGAPNALLDECPCPGIEGREICPLVEFDADLGPIYASSHRRLDPVLDLGREDYLDALPATASNYALPENQCYNEEYAAELDEYFDYPEFEDAYPEQAEEVQAANEYDYPEYFDYEYEAQFEEYEEIEEPSVATEVAAEPQADELTADVGSEEFKYDLYDYNYDYDYGFDVLPADEPEIADDADYAEVEKFEAAIEDDSITVQPLDEAADPAVYSYAGTAADSTFSDADLILDDISDMEVASECCPIEQPEEKAASPVLPVASGSEGVPLWDSHYRDLFNGEIALDAAVHDDLSSAPLAKGRQNVVAFIPIWESQLAAKMAQQIRVAVSQIVSQTADLAEAANQQVAQLPWEDFQAEMDHQIRTLEERELDAMLARQQRVDRLNELFDGITLKCEEAAAIYNAELVQQQRRQALLGLSELLDAASRLIGNASDDVARIATGSTRR
jgi:hypothetical protein